MKKDRKLSFQRYLTYVWSTFAFGVNFDEILDRVSKHIRQNIWDIFFKNVANLWLYAKLAQKNNEKLQYCVFFCYFFVQNGHPDVSLPVLNFALFYMMLKNAIMQYQKYNLNYLYSKK